jgi:hypothetical protein
MPLVLATNSEMTIKITASARETRTPPKIFGMAAGKMMRRSRAARGNLKTRAVSTATGSMVRTPSIVLRSTGQTEPKAINVIRMVDSVPSRMMRTGISAGPGIARRNWSGGSRKSDAYRDRPIRTPSGTPVAMATHQPARSRKRLGTIS